MFLYIIIPLYKYIYIHIYIYILHTLYKKTYTHTHIIYYTFIHAYIFCRNIQKKCWTVGRLSVWVRIFESLLLDFLSLSTKATPWIHLYALVSRLEIFLTYHSRSVHIMFFFNFFFFFPKSPTTIFLFLYSFEIFVFHHRYLGIFFCGWSSRAPLQKM